MDFGLSGKIAIVGGGSMGIGYAIARTLAGEGARVAISARRAPALEEAPARFRAEPAADVPAMVADHRRAEDCARVVAETAARFGGLDILVNNDGAPPLGALAGFDDAAWAKAVEQNLMYVVRMARAA